ncbi:MAG: PAS domain-containing sensor histidine kinase [bacterium]|nr:PAS domain-containing sensor histidine kinase [bacterium]
MKGNSSDRASEGSGEKLAYCNALLEGALDVIVVTDVEGMFRYLSPSVQRNSGYATGELMGKCRFDFLHPEDVEGVRELYRQVMENPGEARVTEHRFKKKDGEWVCMEGTIRSLVEGGKISEIVINLRNITERKRAEQELRESEERFRQFSEATTEGILFHDGGVIIDANQNLADLRGFTIQEMIGRSVYDFIAPECRDLVRQKINSESQERHVLVGIKKDGTRYEYETAARPAHYKGKKVRVVAVRDITRQKQLDRARTDFVTFASHQLRTPLTAIGGYAELLLSEEDGPLTAEQKKYLEKICHNNDRLVELMGILLNVSAIEMGALIFSPTEVDLKKLIDSIEGDFKIRMKQRAIHFSVRLPEGDSKLFHDQKYLRIVIQNILSNAIKYTPDRGKVELLVALDEDDVIISIIDSGYGIPIGEHEKVFSSRLFRGTNVVERGIEGTGFGLYIVKSLVDKMGGSVWFESEVDVGTTFMIRLPLRFKPQP